MSFLLRLCLGLVLLAPSLVYASTLETPGNGDKLSGLGVIRGWKCDAVGDITVKLSDADGNEAETVAMAYGNERGDTQMSCGDTNNGFVSIYNWAILSSGEYTAQAYDNGVAFGAEHSFRVTKAGRDNDPARSYLREVEALPVTVPNFPAPGETTTFEWNQSTQHLEMVMWTSAMPATDLGTCVEELIVGTEEMCSGSLTIAGSNISYTFTVNADGEACIAGTGVPAIDGCHAVSLPAALDQLGVSVTRNEDGSWRIDSLPSSGPVDLGMCRVGLTVQPEQMCSGSLLAFNYTFTVNADGEACIDGTGLGTVDGCHSLMLPDVVVQLQVDVTRNDDGSWTINALP